MSLAGRGVKVAAVILEGDTFGGHTSSLDVYGTLAAGGIYAYTVKHDDDLGRALSEGVRDVGNHDLRSLHEQRVRLVAQTIAKNSKLGDAAAAELAKHVLYALDHIPEKVR